MINIKDFTPYDPNNLRANTYLTKSCHNGCFLGFKDNKIYVNDFTYTDSDEDPISIYRDVFDENIVIVPNLEEAFKAAAIFQQFIDEGGDILQALSEIEGAV